VKTTTSMRIALMLAIWRGTVTSTHYEWRSTEPGNLTVTLVPTAQFRKRWAK
jgi:hypothetical protein